MMDSASDPFIHLDPDEDFTNKNWVIQKIVKWYSKKHLDHQQIEKKLLVKITLEVNL